MSAINVDELPGSPADYREERREPRFVAPIPETTRRESSPWLRHRPWLAAGLFLATCVTTFCAGVFFSASRTDAWSPAIWDGLMYSAAVMTILLSHEMGHYLQALRYGVRTTLPYFIPMPLPPIGTFGAVIVMEPRRGSLKEVFDIGISGPLAGLLPTLIFLWLGLSWSHYSPIGQEDMILGAPLLVKLICTSMYGPLPAGHFVAYHPIALAGWVGLLITSINLVPIGQLDGGHILYGMFRKKAHIASLVLLVLAIAVTVRFWLPQWWLMIGLMAFLGTRHPATVDDSVPLGTCRYVLGFATLLAFIVLGFTPKPVQILGQ